jgi:hypothetical protein
VSIIRTKRRENFTVIPNEIINDSDLNGDLLGLLVYLLSKPADWKVSIESLSRQKRFGSHGKLTNNLKAIRALGYATLQRRNDGTTTWTIFDEKQSEAQADSHIPKTGIRPDSQKRNMGTSENRNVLQRTEISYKELSEEQKTPPLRKKPRAGFEPEPVCGGGSGVFQKKEGQEKERPLAFPEKLNAREKTEALKLLTQIDDQPAQEILDVLAAAIQAGEVRKSPLAVLRGLVSRSRDGTFDPTPGLHLATARERQRQFEAQTQQQVKAAQAELLKVQPPPPGMSGIEQLSATKRRLRGGYSNP